MNWAYSSPFNSGGLLYNMQKANSPDFISCYERRYSHRRSVFTCYHQFSFFNFLCIQHNFMNMRTLELFESQRPQPETSLQFQDCLEVSSYSFPDDDVMTMMTRACCTRTKKTQRTNWAKTYAYKSSSIHHTICKECHDDKLNALISF